MNTPQIAQDLFDEATKSTPFITCNSAGDPDPAKREFWVECKFRTLKEARDFHDKLTRFVSPFVRDELLVENPKDAPLAATVMDGRLVMSIGISTLAHAAANRPTDPLKVTDEEGFAKDVLEHLGDDNFGSNPLEELLDTAMELAADLGSPHIEDPDETLKKRAGLN